MLEMAFNTWTNPEPQSRNQDRKITPKYAKYAKSLMLRLHKKFAEIVQTLMDSRTDKRNAIGAAKRSGFLTAKNAENAKK